MAEAQIILSHSRDSGIVAIASGEQYPWAHTALAESGFRRDDDGVYHLPADGNQTTVVDLVKCAKRHRTSVHTSSRRFIGDAARDLARQLPGQWNTSVEIYSHPHGGPMPSQERNARAWPAIETWLTDGEIFLRQARVSAPHRRPALPVSAPARPLTATRPMHRSH